MKKLILGLGLSGKSVLTYLLAKGQEVLCVDKNASQLSQDPLFREIKIYGEGETLPFHEIESVVKSPGIPWSHPLVQKAVERKLPVTSEMELALNAMVEKKKKLVAITGSNGKTTTTLLLTHILKHAGYDAVAVGNVGTPFLSEVGSASTHFVVELSSFQLETLSGPFFDVGCLLNLSPNHLDRYLSFEEYVEAKFRLQLCLKKEGVLFLPEKIEREYERFLKRECKEKVATILPLGYRHGAREHALHDLENFAAARSMACRLGVEEGLSQEAFSSFIKPPHRIEFVRLYRGVRYINDSKATSCDAVQKALQAMPAKVVWIAGGLDKKGDFASLREQVKEKVSHLLLIGSSAEKIAGQLQGCVRIERAETLGNALLRASSLAQEGESVLFSPGCASYDQFRSYEHRGDVFKQLVNELKEPSLEE